MGLLVLMTGFGEERKTFVEKFNKTLATFGEKAKIISLLAAVKGAKTVIVTIPRYQQSDPESFLEALRAAHPDVDFTGLGIEQNQEEEEEEFPYLSVY